VAQAVFGVREAFVSGLSACPEGRSGLGSQ
jgi:hypothetical protein